MAQIMEQHVEWRVVARLKELLERQPEAEHDVTLTYSLFTTLLCWTCQRMRDRDRPLQVWSGLERERAANQPWGVLELRHEMLTPGSSHLDELTCGAFLIGLRNATAHGDDRCVRPFHTGQAGRADRRLVGFVFDTEFYAQGQSRVREAPIWGEWRLTLTKMDMRRIGLALADRFCSELDGDARHDAERHVLVA